MNRKQRKAKARRLKRMASYAHPTKKSAGSPGETYVSNKAVRAVEEMVSGTSESGVV